MIYITSLVYLVGAIHRYVFSSKLALFSGFMNFVEARDTLMQIPIIEFMVVIVIAEFIIKKRLPNFQSHDRSTL